MVGRPPAKKARLDRFFHPFLLIISKLSTCAGQGPRLHSSFPYTRLSQQDKVGHQTVKPTPDSPLPP